MSNVRNYKDEELLGKVESLTSFKGIPNGYWLLGVQSTEDAYDEFDDKFYVFRGRLFEMSLTGTTNAGADALQNYNKYNPLGTAIIKTDEWYQDLWSPGLHKGKMKCLKQVNPILHYRDKNKDKKAEQTGTLYNKLIGCEFHTATYNEGISFVRKLIGGWSAACQVANNTDQYYKALDLFWTQKFTTYCLIKEF